MAYEAKKSDKFTFGLWTLGNPGRDPFGEPVRKGFTPVEMVRELSKLGAYGVNLHDNDLVPFGSSAAECDRIVKEFKGALNEAGMSHGRSVSTPSSAPRSMAAIVFWTAKARTSALLLVKAPSLKTGWPNRLVVAMGTTMPASFRAPLNSFTMRSHSAALEPNGTRSLSWKLTP